MDDDIFPEPKPNIIEPVFRGVVVTQTMAESVFAQKYAGRLAFCHSHGKWFEFDGNIWRICNTPIAFHYMRELAGKLSVGALQSARMQSANYMGGAMEFARADPVFARTADYWDTDLFLLGTPTGTVDLRTGRLRTSMQSDHITKAAAVAPAETEDCPYWHSFLRETTGEDASMIRFLKQLAGYSLTGDISEQSLFFVYGQGGRGKGTFVNTLQKVMADYATTAPMETFAAQKYAKHETELAHLMGARLVTSSETESGRSWAESRIKQLTGGDMIAARFMRQDFFNFLPQFTLLIMGNFKPALSTIDEAMRRRINILPFKNKPKQKDLRFDEKLEKEWPGILRWMINGCLDWREHGLVRPQAVLDATEEYFEEQNIMKEWLESECVVEHGNPYVTSKTADLFNSWAKFTRAGGGDPGDAKTFKTALEREGFIYKRANTGRYFIYIGLRSENQNMSGE